MKLKTNGWFLGFVLAVALAVLGCGGGGGDGDGPRSSPTSPSSPTASVPGEDANSAPCSATVILQNGTTVVVTGSPGASVSAGNITINFNQTCDFSTSPAPKGI